MIFSCWTYVTFLLLVCTPDFGWCNADSKVDIRAKEKQILETLLASGRYDTRIRPSGTNGTDGPVIVRVNTFVRSISEIDDLKMEYKVQLTFRQQWADERLKFKDHEGRIKYLTLTDTTSIWMPDLFFSNEKEGHTHNLLTPNVYIRIFPHGSVLYSTRISLTLSCPMNLKLFPLDRQVCTLRMASYGFTTEDLVFLWKDGDPVQVVKDLNLPRFTLEKFLTDYCNSKTNTGEYSCLKVDLMFKRELHFYLIQMYIPCCMLVIVSWICFWLDQNATLARFFLGLATLLTLATQTANINASLPPVTYTKAIDVWTGVCLTFVFGALLECVLVNYVARFDNRRKNVKTGRSHGDLEHEAAADLLEDGGTTFSMKTDGERQENATEKPPPQGNWIRTWLSKFPTRSKLIDMISRIAFPVAFAFFNLIYWSAYLVRSSDSE